jgi:hypothetical protein
MKSTILSLFLAVSLTAISAVGSFALTINDISIEGKGAPDSLIYYDTLSSSSKQNELDFIAAGLTKIGISFDPEKSSLTKWDFSEPGDNNYDPNLDYGKYWVSLSDAPGLWAFDFYLDTVREPTYFLIKTAKQVEYQGGYFSYFLYENLGSLQYGVVDLDVFGSNGIDLYKISHLSIPAPEPSTFLLLGGGLAGLALLIRRRKKE